jgi:hypothetical protein
MPTDGHPSTSLEIPGRPRASTGLEMDVFRHSASSRSQQEDRHIPSPRADDYLPCQLALHRRLIEAALARHHEIGSSERGVEPDSLQDPARTRFESTAAEEENPESQSTRRTRPRLICEPDAANRGGHLRQALHANRQVLDR